MVKRDDVQCSERPFASISCDFCEGSDVVLQKEKGITNIKNVAFASVQETDGSFAISLKK